MPDPSHAAEDAVVALPPPQRPNSRQSVVRSRIATYTLMRLLLVTGLFALTTYLLLQNPGEVASWRKFFAMVAVTYLVTGLSAGLLHRFESLDLFVKVQLVIDALLITALVVMTGGLSSIFVILYFMNIVAAAFLANGQVAMITVVFDGVAYLVLIGLTRIGILQGSLDRSSPAEFLLSFFGFLLVGVLTARLSERVRLADVALLKEQESSRALAEEYALIVQSVTSGILIADGNGIIQGANPAAILKLGACVDRPLAMVLPGLSPESEGQEIQVQGPTAPGTNPPIPPCLTLLCNRSPLGKKGAEVVVFEDLTRLREMESEIEQEERFVGVGKVAAAIAHEIRNPLASLSGAIQLLGEEQEGPLLDIALREIHRLNDLVGDFLETARPSRLDRLPEDIMVLLREVVETFSKDPRYHEVVQVVIDGTVSRPYLLDPNRIRQVLWNLLLNAAQSMPGCGTIRVRVSEEQEGLVLQVTDQGVGIGKDEIARIFDPFYTTRQGGTGLGLATVQRLVRAHGGQVSVTSAPGKGSTFRLVIPESTIQ